MLRGALTYVYRGKHPSLAQQVDAVLDVKLEEAEQRSTVQAGSCPDMGGAAARVVTARMADIAALPYRPASAGALGPLHKPLIAYQRRQNLSVEAPAATGTAMQL